MSNLLQEVLRFIVDLGASIIGFIVLILSFVFDSLVILYTDMPMFFGLLAGVLLTWTLTRREKHPVLKVLSSPLKLILDVLDLAWDQAVEVSTDAWEVTSSWVKKPFAWAKGSGKKAYDLVIKGLSLIKVKFSKKKD